MGKVLERSWAVEFRDADSDGLVGLRGYMQYFQEMVSQFMMELGKPLKVTTEQYGIIWIYSKFKAEVYQKADYTTPIQMRLWLEPARSTVRINPVLEITRKGELMFRGRLECCLFKPSEGRIARFEEIKFPMEACSEEKLALPNFSRMPKALPDAAEMLPYVVQYTDLDMSHHMNNQLYISLFLNAFGSQWMESHTLTGFEIHYQTQTYEGVTLQTLRKDTDTGSDLRAVQPDGTVAASCHFEFA